MGVYFPLYEHMKERLRDDPAFAGVAERLDELLDGRRYVGRAPEQVDEFLSAEVEPILSARRELVGATGEVRV